MNGPSRTNEHSIVFSCSCTSLYETVDVILLPTASDLRFHFIKGTDVPHAGVYGSQFRVGNIYSDLAFRIPD